MLPTEVTAKYEERATLGAGAMGVVVEAFDRMIERRVAVKLVNLPGGEDEEAKEARARFRREAQAAGRLSHPNIVGVYEYGETAATAWIVMELVEGGSLKDILDRKERLSVPETVRVMDQVLAALSYSHSRGVVHRDIKPGNIMLAADRTVKLTDFGIARIESSTMTQVGTVMGTPSYMAPEQLRGETVDARADIWAAGVVLYQLLSGEKPFDGGYSALMHRILTAEPPPPSQLTGKAPRGFDAVVARALAKRPDERYPTAAAFAQAIRQAGLAPPEGVEAAGDADATLVVSRKATAGPAAPARSAAAPAAVAPASSRPGGSGGKLMAGVGAAAVIAGVAGLWFMQGGGAPPVQRGSVPPAPTLAVTAQPSPPTLAAPAPVAVPAPATPASAEIGVPPPRPPAAASLSVLRNAALAATTAAPCALLNAVVRPDGLTISGILRRGGEAQIRQALTDSGLPPNSAELRLGTFDGPYCETLNAIRPIAAGPEGELNVDILGNRPLQKGELLRLDVTLPSSVGIVAVSYITQAGEVVHLVPGQAHQGGGQIRLGEPRQGFGGWQVDEPYGTEMVLVVTSERPLFATPRPRVERSADYLTALEPALRTARERGRAVSARAVLVDTVERR